MFVNSYLATKRFNQIAGIFAGGYWTVKIAGLLIKGVELFHGAICYR